MVDKMPSMQYHLAMATNRNERTAMPAKKNTTTTTARNQIVEDIKSFITRFVVFPTEDHLNILALWILHTWAFDAAYATPYMYVHSAEPQSGKTRVREVVSLLARNAMSNDNMTTAAMFRRIEEAQPTLFLDEVDAIFDGTKSKEDLRGIINSGYKQGGSVARFDGKEVIDFNTYCPKMLVGIDNGMMPDTIKDRCIPIALKRKKTSQQVERYIPRKVEPEAQALRERIREWAIKNDQRIMDVPEAPAIDGISDRSFEICEPLLAVAAVLGTTKQTREVIQRLMTGKLPNASLGVRILQAAKDLMTEADTDRIPSAQLAQVMDIHPKKLGIELAKYDVTPTTIKFRGGQVAKGYHRHSFEDAWSRYL